MNGESSRSESLNWRLQENNNNNSEQFKFEKHDTEEFACVLPASANWYCSSILSCLNGYCAVAGKNAVFVVNLRKRPPIIEWDLYGSSGISNKVTAVALMCFNVKEKNAIPEYVALGTEDGLVRVFVYGTRKLLKEHRKHRVKITTMSWSPTSPSSFWTGDEKGNISIWNYEENVVNMWCPLSSQIVSMKQCQIANMVAIGYSNGNIIVADTIKIEILKTYKSHSEDVCSISWCPGVKKFVSCSKDRSMRTWDINLDKPVGTFLIPRKLPGQKSNDTIRAKFFLPVLWLNEMTILSGYPNGELLVWDMTKEKFTVTKHVHTRVIFTICEDTLTNQFVTVSMDRSLIVWDGQTASPAQKIPSFGGFVYSLSTSPLDPHSVAIGVGDNMIRVWSNSDPENRYETTMLWQGLKTKILVVAFHPNKEGILGFGTEDGHVGCYNTLSQKSDISTSYHKKSVYSLSWGPCCSETITNDENTRVKCLFSVGGEGAIFMHKLGVFNKEAENIGKIIKHINKLKTVPLRSEISWRSDLAFVAIGNEDGSIDIFKSAQLFLVCQINIHKKIINCLAWHHDYCATDSEQSYQYWLAAGSNEESVCVYDLSLLQSHVEQTMPIILSKPTHHLTGHSGRITRVVWSPHSVGLLASSSYDGSVQIWDVLKNEPVANFRDHIGRVHCVMWSYTNSNVVYSGGEDFTLRRWCVSEQEHKTPPAAKRTRSKGKKNKKNEPQHTLTIAQETSAVTEKELDSVIETNLINSLSNLGNISSAGIEVNRIPSTMEKKALDFDQKKKKTKSLLKTTAVADTKKKELKQLDCVDLAKYLQAQSEDKGNEKTCNVNLGVGDHINLGYYGSRKDIFKMVDTECASHEKSGNFEQLTQLEVWRNNIGGLIKGSLEIGQLNDTVVSLSPLAGYDMWKAVTLAYAEQLETNRNFHMASVYYLAIGDVHKAIEVYRANGIFREALTLAKMQLTNKDPLINQIYIEWAMKLTDELNYENAAECFMAAGLIDDAITVLAKRADSNSLLTAIKVSDIYGMQYRSSQYLDTCVELLIKEQKWNVCHELLCKYQATTVYHLQIIVGELLSERFTLTDALTLTDGNSSHSYYAKTNRGTITTFLATVLLLLEEELSITSDTVQDFDNFWSHIDLQKKMNCSTPAEVFYQVSTFIFAGIIELLKGNVSECFKYWLDTCDLVANSGNQPVLMKLIEVLFPRNSSTFDDIIMKFGSRDKGELIYCYTNFMAYGIVGLAYSQWFKESNYCEQTTSSEEVNCASHKAISAVTNVNLPSMTYSNDVTRTDIYSVLCYMSSVLLSQTHALFYVLGDELRKVNEKLLELDIRKRLKAQTRSKKEKQLQKVDTDINDEVKNFLNEMIEKVAASFPDTKLSTEHLKRSTLTDEEDLLTQREKLTNELKSIPDFVKTHQFPNPSETIKILLYLGSIITPVNNETRTLLNSIREWGITNGCYVASSSYLERRLKYLL